jgi:hypothetical protein
VSYVTREPARGLQELGTFGSRSPRLGGGPEMGRIYDPPPPGAGSGRSSPGPLAPARGELLKLPASTGEKGSGVSGTLAGHSG